MEGRCVIAQLQHSRIIAAHVTGKHQPTTPINSRFRYIVLLGYDGSSESRLGLESNPFFILVTL